MRNCIIRPIGIADIQNAPNSEALLGAYADECAVPELRTDSPQFQQYAAMEQAGCLFWFGAFVDELLIGFVSIVVSVVPHFGKRIATTESLYVDPAHRKTGAGLDLIRRAQTFSLEKDAEGLFITAPSGSALAKLLPAIGYRQTNVVYFKGLV